MLKIGHRGASAYAPENTLDAFTKAINWGCDGIELDVHGCKGGELIVIHDETVERTTNGKGKVADLTLAQIKALRAGGQPVPQLSTVLDALGRQAYYFMEMKDPSVALTAAELVKQYVSKGWNKEHLWLISFHHAGLREARNYFPDLHTGASFEALTTHSVSEAAALGAKAILPHHGTMTREILAEAHEAGLKVIPWTVNDAQIIARLKTMGVDGIISDYPDRLMA